MMPANPDTTAMPPAERLEPCPFCGVAEHLSVETDIGFGTRAAFVSCALCDCRGPYIVAVTGEESLTVKDAAGAEWNRRSPACTKWEGNDD